MKTKVFNLSIIIVVIVLFFGCGKDGASVLADLFFPNISNQWQSSRNTTFFFNPSVIKVSETDFIGEEQQQNGFASSAFTGKFKNYDIEFTFANDIENVEERGIRYVGKFIKGSDPLRIEAKGSNGVNLVITRGVKNNE